MSQLNSMSYPSRTFIGSKKNDALVFGIDPGVTRLGLHAERNRKPVANATFASDSMHGFTAYSRMSRVVALAEEVHKWISMVQDREKFQGETFVAMETPIFNGRNPSAFELQWRLFQCIADEICSMARLTGFLEVNNQTAKRVATGFGSAKKIDVITASPYDGPGAWNGAGTKALDDYDANQEAIADAWAIAQCIYDGKAGILHSSIDYTACRGPIVQDVMID